MSFTAIVEHDTIKLPPGVHLADGTRVSIEAETTSHPSVADRYSRLIGIADDLPEDLALNHDHYIHGQARKP